MAHEASVNGQRLVADPRVRRFWVGKRCKNRAQVVGNLCATFHLTFYL
jgi:hypothetical protein